MSIENKKIKLYQWVKRPNFGDLLGRFIVERVLKAPVEVVSSNYYQKYLTACGSIIEHINKNATIWGSGLISGSPSRLIAPNEVLAVRGPKTREILMSRYNIYVPKIFGDPAILLPNFIKNRKKKNKVSILPHYTDKNHKLVINSKFNVIDIQNKNPLHTLYQIIESEVLITSSLHGIIIADAYSIPSVWIKLNDKVIGNNFKFYDYFESISSKRNRFEYIDSKKIINFATTNKIEEPLKDDLISALLRWKQGELV